MVSDPLDFGTFRTISTRGPSWWLLSRVDALMDELQAVGVACEHMQADPRPVGVIALWRPNTLVCQRPDCLDQFRFNGSEETECDRCREQSDLITGICWDTELRSLRLLVLLGLCPTCEVEELFL